jgi:signal transduction histidine kinase
MSAGLRNSPPKEAMTGIPYNKSATRIQMAAEAVARRGSGRFTLLALLIIALVASVLLPAIESQRIMLLLREIAEVIEPARTLSWRLESGLAIEYSALQGYAVSGDSALLRQYRSMAADEARQLDSLQLLAARIDPGAAQSAAVVEQRINKWQDLNDLLIAKSLTREEFAAQMKAQRARRDSIISEIDGLPVLMSSEAASRRARVRAHEQRSLVINAVLVIVALGAIAAVVGLTRRERHLTAMLERRVEEEGALREAAEALAGAFTIDDVTQQLARSALSATKAQGVWVEYVGVAENGSLESTVRGAAGTAEAKLGVSRNYSGSYAEQAINIGHPVMLADLHHAGATESVEALGHESAVSTIVVPIGKSGAPRGALFITGAPRGRLLLTDTGWTPTFAHLAALAYEKVRLIDEAREGRRELERVMRSRQRLMRGFSHDVKNPLGAADGYADLLSAGIYGGLSTPQLQSVERIRRSIHRALSLIDDLHELARAETGNIPLRLEPVNIGDLARSSAEEYRGAATANGLTLNVDVPDDLPTVVTDGTRVTQIVGNLLSNAIKYTKAGSVTLRVRSEVARAEGISDAVSFDVIDTGIGIPADKKEIIFEEFSRLHESDKPGAGLGLAISTRIAELLGGTISLESEPGRGSTFTLRIHSYAVPSELGQYSEAHAATVDPVMIHNGT